MTLEELIIAVVRVLGSLFVLRWALVGGLIAILVDLSDLFLKNLLSLGGVRNYQAFDKILDQIYLGAFLAVALWRWRGLARSVAAGLYAFRLAGFVAYELSGGSRLVLFLFPNVFEFWFIYVAAMAHIRPGFRYTPRNAAIALVPLTALKLFHEYALHVGKWLDGFTAVEAVEAIWDFFTAPFG
jgi:hypothetical protein